jgi:hypothetical protein
MDQVNELWIGEIPAHQLASFEVLLADFGVQSCASRANLSSTFTIHASSEIEQALRASLASELSKLSCPFELMHIGLLGERYAFLPHLGLHRCDLNEIGEELLSYSRFESLIEISNGSNRELRRLVDLALGKPWIEALDLIRSRSERRVA